MSGTNDHLGQNRTGKAATHRRQSSQGQRVLAALLCVCLPAVLILVFVNFTFPWFAQSFSATPTEESQDIRSGTITLQSAQGDCQILKFDNDTGRPIGNSEQCHQRLTFDSHGVPIPLGTVHRLQSISKSFSGN